MLSINSMKFETRFGQSGWHSATLRTWMKTIWSTFEKALANLPLEWNKR